MHFIFKTLIAVSLLATSQVQAEEEGRESFGNMVPEAIAKLNNKVGFVNNKASFTKREGYGLTNFSWFIDSKSSVSCNIFRSLGRHVIVYGELSYIMRKAPYVRAKIPVAIFKNANGNTYTGSLRYKPDDGTLNTYYFNTNKRIWKVSRSGHLQKRIPAVVYKLCPKFPSAESLGAEINHKQTSDNYFELIKQDPGERILRPDLVTNDPVIRY